MLSDILHHHQRQDVRQELGEQHAQARVAGKPRRLDEAGLAPDVHLGARDAGIESAG